MQPLRHRSLLFAIITLLLIASSISSALAISSGPPSQDASTYNNGATSNDDRLRVEAGTPACENSRSRITYLKWPLTDVARPIATATLSFRIQSVNFGAAAPGAQNVVLYSTESVGTGGHLGDDWTETTITSANQPNLVTVLETKPIPESGTGDILFNSPALVSYLNQEATGDKTATLALALSGNCGETAVTLRLYSKDQTTNPKPDLQMLEPTAVGLRTVSAERTSWPFYAGLGAVGLAVVAGIFVARRHAA